MDKVVPAGRLEIGASKGNGWAPKKTRNADLEEDKEGDKDQMGN